MSFIKILSLLLSVILLSFGAKAGEDSTYKFSWLDQDKEVFVLQNRKFRKKQHAYIFVGGGVTTSGAFVDSSNFQGRAGFFFKEEFGFEIVYSVNNGSENTAAQSVRSTGSASTPFRRIVDDYLGAMVIWAPFYGKVNTFNAVVYYDWFLGLGIANLNETNNRIELNSNGLDKTPTSETHTGLMWSTALKFWITQNWSARIDLTAIHYRAQAAKANTTANNEANYSNFDTTLGLEFNF